MMKRAPRLSRREFLTLGGAAGAGLLLGGTGLLAGCGGPFSAEILAAGTPVDHDAVVAAARGRDLYAITHQALAGLGGIGTVVRPGESVFIKPNLLTAGLRRVDHTRTGEIAKPEVIVATAEACLLAGAREVIIGDGAQVHAFDWEELRTLDGATHLAAEVARLNDRYDHRVQLACLNRDTPGWDAVPARRMSFDTLLVSSLVMRADRVISIPVLKTHRFATVSLSLKNFMGVMPISEYGGGSERIGRYILHNSPGGLEGAFLDVVEAVRPDLAVIDGSIGCEGYAPWVRPGEGRTVDLRERLGDWLVLASADPVAADATAARLMRHDPWRVRHLQRAYDEGLGQLHESRIALVGAALDELQMDWEPAPRRAPG